MNNKISATLFFLFVVAGLGIYWGVNRNQNAANQNPETVLSELKKDSVEKRSQRGARNKTTVVMSNDEFISLKNKAAEQQKALDQLVLELNRNLDNPAKSKAIQDKYKLQTEEYNKLVLQIVKYTKSESRAL